LNFNSLTCPGGLVLGNLQRDLLFPNNKQITMTEIQNPKQKTIAFNQFGIYYLKFINNWVLVICDFRHKNPNKIINLQPISDRQA
jgi:hypothetical protein